MHGDAGDGGDGAEGDGSAQETEGVTATGPAEGAVLVVRGGVVPGAEAGTFLGRAEAGGFVHVAHGDDVWGDGIVVGGGEAGAGEGTGNKDTRGWVRGRRRTVWMERAGVVFGRAVFVAGERGDVRTENGHSGDMVLALPARWQTTFSRLRLGYRIEACSLVF